MPHTPKPSRLMRLWPLMGFLGGWAIGLVDLVFFHAADIEMRLEGRDVTVMVTLFFGLTFALLGYALGRLAQARARARADHRTIAEQHTALLESQEALVRQEKLAALGRLVASIAHELRNPLGVIRSAAGVLRERSEGDSQQLRAAELVTEEVDHLNATITALLAFARPARLELAGVAVERILDRACQLTAARTEENGVEVASRLADELPEVLGDANLLSQVVAGLVDNAAEAVAETDGGRIELRAAPARDQLCIEVADNGPGIAEDEAARVFEPFYTTKASGTGLGLALAHRIADAHGGSLEVVPGAGVGPGHGGACLRLSLPIHQQA